MEVKEHFGIAVAEITSIASQITKKLQDTISRMSAVRESPMTI